MPSLGDIMTRRPAMVAADATLNEALDAMQERGISSVLVTPRAGSAEYGILTMSDILSKVVTQNLDPEGIRVGDVTTWRLVTAKPSWTFQQAAAVMTASKIRRLPVTEGDEIVGLVSDTDLFTALAPQREWEHARHVRKERALRRAAQMGPARRVADLMSSPVLAIGRDATIQEAVEKMVAGGISSLLVSTNGNGPKGIITKRDVIRKVMAEGRDPYHVSVGDAMSSPLLTITPEATIEECSRRMTDEHARRFPVERDGQIIGIISDSDILAAVAARRWRGIRHRTVPTSLIVADIMRSPAGAVYPVGVESLSPELSLWEAAGRLASAGVRQMPVVQEGVVIGLISEADIARAMEERSAPD